MTNQPTKQTRDSAKRAATYLSWQRGIIYQVYPRCFMQDQAAMSEDLREI